VMHRSPDGQGQLDKLPTRGPMAGWMPEAAGRGEGETADNGKLTWAVDRGPSPADASVDMLAGGLGGLIRLTGA